LTVFRVKQLAGFGFGKVGDQRAGPADGRSRALKVRRTNRRVAVSAMTCSRPSPIATVIPAVNVAMNHSALAFWLIQGAGLGGQRGAEAEEGAVQGATRSQTTAWADYSPIPFRAAAKVG
jgi:hypothetical protein